MKLGLKACLTNWGRSGIEMLIEQELLFLGQIYAAILDLTSENISGEEADLLVGRYKICKRIY
jgi:hypothetical protein